PLLTTCGRPAATGRTCTAAVLCCWPPDPRRSPASPGCPRTTRTTGGWPPQEAPSPCGPPHPCAAPPGERKPCRGRPRCTPRGGRPAPPRGWAAGQEPPAALPCPSEPANTPTRTSPV